MIMTLLSIFIILCIVGLILWGIQSVPGVPPIVKTVILVIIGVLLLLWCLNAVQGGGIHLGNLR